MEPINRLNTNYGGMNLTPIELIDDIRCVITGKENYQGIIKGLLDPSTNKQFNDIGAETCWDMQDDGFPRLLDASCNTCFINAPGTSVTGSSPFNRLEWAAWKNAQAIKTYVGTALSRERAKAKPDMDKVAELKSQIPTVWSFEKPKEMRQIKATQWYNRAFDVWKDGDIENLICLVYAAGSLGSLSSEFYQSGVLCLTGKDGLNPNGSGRIQYDNVLVETGERERTKNNPQSSAIIGFFRDNAMEERFIEKMKFGWGPVFKTI